MIQGLVQLFLFQALGELLSKFALLAVAVMAASVAMLKPSDILSLVTASFSLAAAALVPAMVLGIFWQGATGRGAACGMLAGLGITVYYLLVNSQALRSALGLPPGQLWWGILPVAGGVFGVAVGLVTTVLVSLVDRRGPTVVPPFGGLGPRRPG